MQEISFNLAFNVIVEWMVRIGLIMMMILGVVMIRQESLMEKVVDIPLKRGMKILVWSFFALSVMFTLLAFLM